MSRNWKLVAEGSRITHDFASFLSLCENMGGVYLDGDTLKFNPFANVLDDNNFDASAERIRDQLSVMASPNGNLDEVHEGLLLQAVKAAWLTKHNKARIDDVVDFLQEAKDSETYADSPTIRSRLDEMIILLDQYTVTRTITTLAEVCDAGSVCYRRGRLVPACTERRCGVYADRKLENYRENVYRFFRFDRGRELD